VICVITSEALFSVNDQHQQHDTHRSFDVSSIPLLVNLSSCVLKLSIYWNTHEGCKRAKLLALMQQYRRRLENCLYRVPPCSPVPLILNPRTPDSALMTRLAGALEVLSNANCRQHDLYTQHMKENQSLIERGYHTKLYMLF
jgi:hypothetical protein